MQNRVVRQYENGKSEEITIFHEFTDTSGFVLREMIETKNKNLRWQAGRYTNRPMRIPVYSKSVVSHHIDGDDIKVFYLVAVGKTKEEALVRASDKLLRAEMCKQKG